MHLIGYARVSTEDQPPCPSLRPCDLRDALRYSKSTPQAATVRGRCSRELEHIGKGDTLVVGRIDRLARSLSRLLGIIDWLEAKDAFCISFQDPIGTSSPQGKFTLQVLGAAAEFERALIRERTKAGPASARAKGRVGGSFGFRAMDPTALRKVRLARQEGYMEPLNETAQDWVPHVRRLRPDMAWEYVVQIINGPLPHARQWTQSRFLRAVNAYMRNNRPAPAPLRCARLRCALSLVSCKVTIIAKQTRRRAMTTNCIKFTSADIETAKGDGSILSLTFDLDISVEPVACANPMAPTHRVPRPLPAWQTGRVRGYMEEA